MIGKIAGKTEKETLNLKGNTSRSKISSYY